MTDESKDLPGQIAMEFTTPGGRPLMLGDLGQEFLEREDVIGGAQDPFRVQALTKTSKAGNLYFSWDMSRVPLPDGFSTCVRVEGVPLKPGLVRDSKNGNPMRQDKAELLLGGIPHLAKLTIVKGRKPYWVSLVVHKKPRPKPKAAKASS